MIKDSGLHKILTWYRIYSYLNCWQDDTGLDGDDDAATEDDADVDDDADDPNVVSKWTVVE